MMKTNIGRASRGFTAYRALPSPCAPCTLSSIVNLVYLKENCRGVMHRFHLCALATRVPRCLGNHSPVPGGSSACHLVMILFRCCRSVFADRVLCLVALPFPSVLCCLFVVCLRISLFIVGIICSSYSIQTKSTCICLYLLFFCRVRLLGKVAALVNMLCFLNASLGVCVVMALINLFVRPFSAATVRRLVSDGVVCSLLLVRVRGTCRGESRLCSSRKANFDG